MGSIQTYYKVLGIRSAASLDDIKKAFLEKERGLQPDFQSEDPEKRKQATETLNELYEAHEKVVRHFMEHGPPKFQEEAGERAAVREAPSSGAATEPTGEATGDTPERGERNEEETSPALAPAPERLQAKRTMGLPLVISLAILFSVSVGSLIGVMAFRSGAKKTVTSQTAQQIAMTTGTPHQPLTSRGTGGTKQVRTEEASQREIPIEKRREKKSAKAGKHRAAKPAARISRQILEDTMNAAKQGDAEAQYRLGAMYSRGVGVRKDTAEAMKWYRRAASRGHAKARESLEYVYE